MKNKKRKQKKRKRKQKTKMIRVWYKVRCEFLLNFHKLLTCEKYQFTHNHCDTFIMIIFSQIPAILDQKIPHIK